MEKIFEKMASLCDPRLNPFFYPDITPQDALVGYLTVMGVMKLPKPESPFVVGENIACTAGNVIYENHVCQLIHYTQTDDLVYKIPLLITPPWINKYYVFDLGEEKSIIKWLIDSGFDVYCISWINADRSHEHLHLDTYIKDGITACSQFICESLQTPQLHAIGYCIGGVGLSLAALSNPNLFRSLTFLATPFNFDELEQLNEYINENSLIQIKEIIKRDGVFHGERLYHLFSQLKANEMIYQDVIDRVYLKKDMPIIDYLHWNNDVSNIPGKAHVDYIENIYLTNTLTQKMAEQALTMPVFVMCGEKDHIVPPKASLEAWNVFQNIHFCIGKGGHVAGIIHNPRLSKYPHRLYKKYKKDLDMCKSKEHEGSWWQSWLQWIQPILGERTMKRDNLFDPIEKAPGRYVKQQVTPLEIFF